MDGRFLTRLLSAFLFAIVIVVIIHFGLWYASTQVAENRVVANLADMQGMHVEHGPITASGYPSGINLQIKDLSFAWAQPDKGITVTYTPGTVMMNTEMFNQGKIELKLPKMQHLTITKNNVTNTYEVLMEGGRLIYFNRGNSQEMSLNVDAFSIIDHSNPTPRAVLRSGACYFVRSTPGEEAPVDWRISLSHFNLADNVLGEPVAVDGFLADYGLSMGQALPLNTLLPTLMSDDLPTRRKRIQSLLDLLGQTGIKVKLEGLQVNQNGFWFTMRGDIGLDGSTRPQGNVSLTTNKIAQVTGYLVHEHMVDPTQLQTQPQLAQIMVSDNNTHNFDMAIRQGRVTISGVDAGQAPTAAQLLLP